MSTLNLQINAIAFSDTTPSNNPQIRTFDFTYKLLGNNVSFPKSENFSIAPGSIQTIFNGTKTTTVSPSTAFNITQPHPSQPNIYRFSAVSGTPPTFRTARSIGIDNTSQVQVTVNGPIAVLTSIGGTMMNTTPVVIGDVLKIYPGAGLSFPNQGTFTVIAKTVTSITVQNLNAVAETATILDFTQFLVYSNGGSSNQIQIGNKVIISAGFSQVTWGTYVVNDVTPSSFEVTIAPPNGIPLESNVMPGSSGLIFYSSAKQFIMLAAQQKCSVQVNADVSDNTLLEPVEADNQEKPALYIKQGTVYALSITNLSLETLSVIVASAE